MKPDMTKENEQLSDLEIAINNRKRATFEFEIQDVLGHTKKPLGKVKIRAATLAEQEEAVKKADEYTEKNASLRDPDAFENIKTAHILQKVCLSASNERNVPAFPTADYMIKNLGTQELAVLINNYHEVLRISDPIAFVFDDDTLKKFAELCALYDDTDAPNMYLQNYGRDHVAEIAIRIGALYHRSQAQK